MDFMGGDTHPVPDFLPGASKQSFLSWRRSLGELRIHTSTLEGCTGWKQVYGRCKDLPEVCSLCVSMAQDLLKYQTPNHVISCFWSSTPQGFGISVLQGGEELFPVACISGRATERERCFPLPSLSFFWTWQSLQPSSELLLHHWSISLCCFLSPDSFFLLLCLSSKAPLHLQALTPTPGTFVLLLGKFLFSWTPAGHLEKTGFSQGFSHPIVLPGPCLFTS